MRDAFFQELAVQFEADERVVFLTGDLGYKLYEPLREIDERRVINFGIREGAMVGFAAGLAKTGMRPFVYSIVPFLTLRSLEQIKLDLCYNRANVVLVGVGGGYAYGPNGPTHYGVDDYGALSAFPNMRIWTPCDPNEVRACVRAAETLDSPAYLRLGRNREPLLRDDEGRVDAPVVLRDGNAGTVVSCGVILDEVLKAAELLSGDGVEVRVVHVPTLKPLDVDRLVASFVADKPVLSVEEHVAAGGLGQRVGAMLAEAGHTDGFKALTAPDAFPEACLSRDAALEWAGLNAGNIAKSFQPQMDTDELR